jgi:SAM-dependent MidA family methyltransferase
LKELVEKIAGEIKNRGIISFAQFMRLALYCPNYGFYEKDEDKIGRAGDFFTSVSVGELFGQLLAFQFAAWLEQVELPDDGNGETRLQLVEAGGHRGDLAKDVLAWLQRNRPRLFERVEYCLVEPSARRRKWQGKTMLGFENKVRWVSDLEQLGERGVRGIIFSNELLDAMPVHRVTWNAEARNWVERGVSLNDGAFEWATMSPEQGLDVKPTWLGQLPEDLLDVLPNGFTTELALETESWWAAAARALRWGKLMTIDYGFTTEELLAPERKNGTLRAYQDHHVSSDVLRNPGEQDLTAHVNFSSLERTGEKAGLTTELFTTQSRFLGGIFSRIREQEDIKEKWNPKLTRQFQTLANPEHLGHSFRVLVQGRY